jgi:WNK lysine deficient protein kinase
MESEQPVNDIEVVEVPQESEKGPDTDKGESAEESYTVPTPTAGGQEEPAVMVFETTGDRGEAVIGLKRSNSAPLEEDEPSDDMLSAEALEQAKNSPNPQVAETSTSLNSVDPDAPLPRELSALSETEFEEFINSPRGQNVIVERSPGGRYVRFMEKLGSGASKDVYRAYDTTEGIEVAWNVVNLAGVPKAERNRIVNEVRLLERLHHHNIISFHGSWVNRERQEVNFVTEILSSGTLKSFIDKVQVIRWKIAKRWARQILAGLAYLHEQDPPVIHRDLKCDNIFINGTSGDLRIGDLGLSTVHRNGKVLSVLGTPEFMAPDLYEETCYDEKVDIYAFGMALLEIFTKDIPYRECSNPAQIYRKVTRGDPPESLARVRSKEARDFIILCMGYKDEATGKYIRPSAKELLNHPFLGAGPDDESEVEISPPLMERTIREESGDSDLSRRRPKGVTTKIQIPAPPQHPAPEGNSKPDDPASQGNSPLLSGRSPVPPRRDGVPPRPNQKYASQNSLDDDSDHFDDMPDSEVNIVRKVKVMMGRGQELESTEADTSSQITAPLSTAIEEPAGANPDASHYLVAVAVIEEESPLVRPYKDDILKLIIRLPVEGQTQNVQFDFHLIEDDPVQVAKEMVTELGIPQEAILEISETISAHARNARMKQDKHSNRQQWQQDQQMLTQNVQAQPLQQQQQPGIAMPQQQHVIPQQQQNQQSMMSQNIQGQGMQQQQQHQPGIAIPRQQQDQPVISQNIQGPGMQQLPGITMPQQQIRRDQQMTSQSFQGQGAQQQSGMAIPQQQQLPTAGHQVATGQQLPPHRQSIGQSHPTDGQQLYLPHPQGLDSRSLSGGGQPQQPMYSQDGTSQDGSTSQHGHQLYLPHPQRLDSRSLSGDGQVQQPMYSQHPVADGTSQDGHTSQHVHMQHAPQQHVMQQAHVPMMQQNQVQQQVPHEVPYQGTNHLQFAAAEHQALQPPRQIPTQPEAPSSSYVPTHADPPNQYVPVHPEAPPNEYALAHPEVPPMAPQQAPPSHVPPSATVTENSLHVEPHDTISALTKPVDENGVYGTKKPDSPLRNIEMEAVSSDTDDLETNDDDDEDDDERAMREEMRRLDEDFKKNMLRAQKVFDSRMDNLQRSKEEREAQHLKTLEKHEKERAEFEKRLQQAEKEQNRRIEQLQREWDKKRQSLAKHKGGKKKLVAADVPSMGGDEVSELAEANAASLGTLASSVSREKLIQATHKKSSSLNNSESSERSRSSSSTSLNGGDSGNNSDHDGVT